MNRVNGVVRPALAVDSGIGRICQAGEMYKSGPTRPAVAWRTFGQYALVYVLEGAGRYEDAGGIAREITGGDLIFIFPTLAHRYGPDASLGQSWREFYIVFEGPAFELWEQNDLLNPAHPVQHLEPVAVWQKRLTGVLDPAPPGSAGASLAEVCRLQQLLADVRRAGDGAASSRDAAWLARARVALDADDDLHGVADQLCCSYATFRRRFTELAGMAPTRYRAQRIIERACDLMHRTDLSDKQIAGELGFCDEFHFSRRFKQVVGMSPRMYRRSLP